VATFVLSVISEDRSGLVAALSGVVARHGGNWERAHLTHLAGRFAGVVLVTVPDVGSSAFLADLAPLRDEGLLEIAVDTGTPVPAAGPVVHLDLIGQDHPGIVHEVTSLLASHQVSIDELTTWTADAPMDGSRLFGATAALRLPPGLAADRLGADLEALAADLMVDIVVDPEPAPGEG